MISTVWGMVLIVIIIGLVILIVTTISDRMVINTLELMVITDAIKKVKTIDELNEVAKDLDELPILFRTNSRGRAIKRIEVIIEHKRKKINGGI